MLAGKNVDKPALYRMYVNFSVLIFLILEVSTFYFCHSQTSDRKRVSCSAKYGSIFFTNLLLCPTFKISQYLSYKLTQSYIVVSL